MNCCLCLVVLLFHTCVTMCCRLRGVIDTTVRLLVYVGERATTVEGKKEGGGAACLCVCRVCVLLYLSSRLWSLVTPCSFAKPTIWDAGIDRANRSRAHKIERERERERQGGGRRAVFIAYICTLKLDKHHYLYWVSFFSYKWVVEVEAIPVQCEIQIQFNLSSFMAKHWKFSSTRCRRTYRKY